MADAKKPFVRTKRPPGEAGVLEVIAEMPDSDRAIATKLHETIRASAPELTPKLWYGQPAYAKDGKVICFFRGAAIDGERYLTFGFSGDAKLDDGGFWPTAFAVAKLSAADAKKVAALVKQATS
ncbi:DUF1801 domain-containing protein [Aquihabitans daechungensis]|uniref:DUF1801 domain-containing protein n=1 Tax=Aquihabitans daechungensis TaxID=1052257 RepID=UPI003BA0B029